MITDIFEIEKNFKNEIGEYLINNIIPFYMENYELGKNFTKDDKLTTNAGYSFWTGENSVYIQTGLIKYKITDNDLFSTIVQYNADFNGQERMLLSYWKEDKTFDVVNINHFALYTEVFPFFAEYFEEKISDANGIR